MAVWPPRLARSLQDLHKAVPLDLWDRSWQFCHIWPLPLSLGKRLLHFTREWEQHGTTAQHSQHVSQHVMTGWCMPTFEWLTPIFNLSTSHCRTLSFTSSHELMWQAWSAMHRKGPLCAQWCWLTTSGPRLLLHSFQCLWYLVITAMIARTMKCRWICWMINEIEWACWIWGALNWPRSWAWDQSVACRVLYHVTLQPVGGRKGVWTPRYHRSIYRQIMKEMPYRRHCRMEMRKTIFI